MTPTPTGYPDESAGIPVRTLARWVGLLLRPFAVGIGVWLLFQIPLPVLDPWLPLKNVMGVVAGLTLGGKCLVDTLFFSRFWP